MAKTNRQSKKPDATPPFNFVGIKPVEHLTIRGKASKYELPEEVVAQLNRVTQSFANAQHLDVAGGARRWETKMRALRAWQRRTAGIQKLINPSAPEPSRAPGLVFDEIVDRYFQPELSSAEERDPMAVLARVLNGAIDTSKFAQRNCKYPAPRTFEAELWFLWTSIVFGILRAAKVPLRYKNAQRLLPHAVPLLDELQIRLPKRFQKRYSPGPAAVVAFRFTGVCELPIMLEVFDRWTKGDVLFARVFAPTQGDADEIFMFAVKFERYFLKATGRARKTAGMGSRQN